MAYTTFGGLHMLAASVGLITGATQVIRTRRDAFHRRMGYTYMGAMTVSNFTALTIYEFSGTMNAFHFFAIFSLFSMGMALRPLIKKPRPPQWKINHYMWITWSYCGLCAAAVTEFLLRVPRVHWAIATSVGTLGVMAIGAVLIYRFAPKTQQKPS